jgi:hypothetical protein
MASACRSQRLSAREASSLVRFWFMAVSSRASGRMKKGSRLAMT